MGASCRTIRLALALLRMRGLRLDLELRGNVGQGAHASFAGCIGFDALWKLEAIRARHRFQKIHRRRPASASGLQRAEGGAESRRVAILVVSAPIGDGFGPGQQRRADQVSGWGGFQAQGDQFAQAVPQFSEQPAGRWRCVR